MAADTGMSLKERLALLQANNKNPSLSGPMKSPTHKAAPSTSHDNNNDTKPNGPLTPLKPVLKPVSTTSTGADTKKEEESAATQVPFKLRPTGAQFGPKALTPKVTITPTGATPPAAAAKPDNSSAGMVNSAPSATKKPSDFRGAGTGGVNPLVPKKPGTGADGSTEPPSPVALRDKFNTPGAAARPPSLQERMKALREKAEGGDSVSAGPGPKSPEHGPKKVAFSPPARADGPVVKPSDLVKSLKEAANRKKASESFIRKSDGKRFRKVDMATVVENSPDPAPPKPPALDDVDLHTFLQAYATAKGTKLASDAAKCEERDASGGGGGEEGDMEELYVQAESEMVPLRVKGRGSVKRAMSVRVSEIPEFTEEEEQEELYMDGKSTDEPGSGVAAGEPEEEYDDCASALATVQSQQQTAEFEDPDEIYEPLDEEMDSTPPPPEPLASPGPTDDKKGGKKDKEKEKKKDKGKDEASKREERERKKREDEIKKQRAKFGLKDDMEKVGEGVVKNNASGGMFSKDLAVNKGEIVTILRMDHNPSGKWLVQNDQGKLGYVSSNNIEVATPAIRQILDSQSEQMMSGAKNDSLPGDEPDEMYEPLPGEEEMDEIYEEL